MSFWKTAMTTVKADRLENILICMELLLTQLASPIDYT